MTVKKRDITVEPPKERPLTQRQAERLSVVSGLEVKEIANRNIVELEKEFRFQIDPRLLRFHIVCGKVVKRDPATGDLHPVPFATVHLYDTDCNFWLYAPNGWPWVWLFSFGCRKEEIATARTDECGNFCVFIPRWDIDYIMHWRHERVCFPEIFVKPRIDDLIPWQDIPREKPRFKFPPEPAPDPLPYERIKTQLQILGAHDAIQRLQDVVLRIKAGEPAAKMKAELNQPLFETTVPPPMPQTWPESEETKQLMEAMSEMAEGTSSTGEAMNRWLVLRDRFIGPFFRCFDIWFPEWTRIMDVPDITFEVTQDVNNDGHEELIYSEGFFDVRWDSSGLNAPVTLYADPIAITSSICEQPTLDCTDVGILMAGLMPVTGTDGGLYHDRLSGYALRPNKPRPSGSWTGSQSSPANAPYRGTLQLYGCNHHTNAQYYRLLYSYNDGPWVPFTQHSWKVFRWHNGHLQTRNVAPDADGWYDILPPNQDWYPDHLLLNWPTTSYPDGRYRVKMQFGNTSKSIIHETQEVAFRVDNSKPHLGLQVEYRLEGQSEWTLLDSVCPVINRSNKEAVHFRVTATMTAEHARSVKVWGSTCGAGGLSLASSAPPKWEVSGIGIRHWHTDASDNTATVHPEFTLAANANAGVYSFHLQAWERSFNPSGGDHGYEQDWNYDPDQVWRYTVIHVAVV